MKYAVLIAGLLFGMPMPQGEVDVPSVSIEVPAPHPCNLDPGPVGHPGGMVYASCLTGPETHWTCTEKSRVLLEGEDGVKHCIDFKLLRAR